MLLEYLVSIHSLVELVLLLEPPWNPATSTCQRVKRDTRGTDQVYKAASKRTLHRFCIISSGPPPLSLGQVCPWCCKPERLHSNGSLSFFAFAFLFFTLPRPLLSKSRGTSLLGGGHLVQGWSSLHLYFVPLAQFWSVPLFVKQSGQIERNSGRTQNFAPLN